VKILAKEKCHIFCGARCRSQKCISWVHYEKYVCNSAEAR